MSALLIIRRRDLDVVLDDFYKHIVLYETHNVLAPDPWAYA